MKKIISISLLAFTLNHAAALALEPNVGNFSISKGNFTEIYNQYRFAQPQNVPWAGSFWAYSENGIAKVLDGQTESPAAKFDRQFGLGTQTVDFEKQQHTCDTVPEAQKEGCRGWYGHCNAWSGAAIKEPEPSTPVKLGDMEFSVADQKAYLTEMWMEVNASYGGTTNKGQVTGDWILDPKSDIGAKIKSSGLSNYDTFWDVSPKNFLLLFTNYIGVLKLGVVIDRFTGDQVWNQPAAGYRILPLRNEDLGSEVKDGTTVYFARMRMKIYWANDGVDEGIVSSKFDIATTTDTESADYFPNHDYTARLLKFRLFFDAPVVLQDDKVLSAGRMIGKGLWNNQEFPPSSFQWYDHAHPDFIWMPTQLYFSSGYGNPTLTSDRVYQVTHAPAVVKPVEVPVEPVEPVVPSAVPSPVEVAVPVAVPVVVPVAVTPVVVTPVVPSPGPNLQPASLAGADGESTPEGVRRVVKVLLSGFAQHDVIFIKGKIFRTLRRADILSIMHASDLKIVGDHVEQPGIFPKGETLPQINAALTEAGYKVVP